MNRMMIALAAAMMAPGCATVPSGGHVDVEAVSVGAERTYAAAAASSLALAMAGMLPVARVKESDAKAYAILVAGRAIHDALRPIASDMSAARAAADDAHFNVQSL